MPEELQVFFRDDVEPHLLFPGECVLHEGTYYACTPNGLLANLSRHSVVENDGLLTVSPSILVKGTPLGSDGLDEERQWHGFIENGFWREA